MGFKTEGEGTVKLVFDDYGNLEIKDQQVSVRTYGSVMGQKTDETEKTRDLIKYDNGVIYSVDFDEKVIYKSTNLSEQVKKILGADPGKTAKEYAESLGGKQIGEELFEGYKCEIWEMMGTKSWLYKGVPLKVEAEMMGIKVTQIATSIDFGSVSLKEFELPDFTIKEMEIGTDAAASVEKASEIMKNMNDVQNLTFEEWKKNMQMADKSFKEMNDSELHQLYDEMKKMSELMQE